MSKKLRFLTLDEAFHIIPRNLETTQAMVKKARARQKQSKRRSILSQPFVEKYSPYVVAVLMTITILFISVIRLALRTIPLERDEGEYAYAGQLLLKGFPPYQYAYNMKFPGIYAAYAALLAVFGQTPAGIRLGVLLVNITTIALIFLLIRRLLDSYAATAGAASFAVLSLGQPVLGTFAHATHFVILFAVAGLLAMVTWIDKDRAIYLFLSGILFGIAVLMKQHGIMFALFGVLYVGWNELRIKHAPWRDLLKSGLVFLGALAIPFLITVGILAWAGVLAKFWFWTFKYASTYVSQVPFSAAPEVLYAKLQKITTGTGLIWLLVLLGAATLLWNAELKTNRTLVAGFTVFSFLAVCPGLYFREHYFIQLLPAAALLIGVAVSSMRQFLQSRNAIDSALLMPGAVVLLIIGISLFQQRDFLFQMNPLQASRATYGRNPFPETLEAAKYIKANSDASDRVAVLGSEPQVYFYADRLSATGHIYMYGLMEPQPYAAQMQQEMIGEIESARPRFLVYIPGNESWLKRPGSDLSVFDWLPKYVKNEFDLVGVAEIVSLDTTKYYWDDDARRYNSSATPVLLVYKRKQTLAQ